MTKAILKIIKEFPEHKQAIITALNERNFAVKYFCDNDSDADFEDRLAENLIFYFPTIKSKFVCDLMRGRKIRMRDNFDGTSFEIGTYLQIKNGEEDKSGVENVAKIWLEAIKEHEEEMARKVNALEEKLNDFLNNPPSYFQNQILESSFQNQILESRVNDLEKKLELKENRVRLKENSVRLNSIANSADVEEMMQTMKTPPKYSEIDPHPEKPKTLEERIEALEEKIEKLTKPKINLDNLPQGNYSLNLQTPQPQTDSFVRKMLNVLSFGCIRR